MGAITAAALAVSSARGGNKVKLVLESPAFLSKLCDRLEPSKIGRVTALALRWQRRVLRLVLQLPGLTYSRRFWQRGLAMAGPMEEERARLQVLRYRWPSLCEHWALGLANFDGVVPVARSKDLQKLLHCDLELMEGRGHIAHEEDPAEFAKLVANFVADAADAEGKKTPGVRDFGMLMG
eukprot:s1192_g11.t1